MACEETEDPASEATVPEIKVDFVSAQTRSKVDTLLKNSNRTITAYTDSIKNGGDSIYYTQLIDGETVVKDSLNEILSLLKAGRVKLDSIYAIGGIILKDYQDTTNSAFSLPVNISSDSTTYVFKYLDLSDSLTFTYLTKTVTGLDKISIVAYNIDVVDHTFDSLTRHYCFDENCTNGEILFKVYF